MALAACTLSGMTPICLQQQHRGGDRRARAVVIEANFASAMADASHSEDGSTATSNERGACTVGMAAEAAGWPVIFGLHESAEYGDEDGADASGSLYATVAAA